MPFIDTKKRQNQNESMTSLPLTTKAYKKAPLLKGAVADRRLGVLKQAMKNKIE